VKVPLREDREDQKEAKMATKKASTSRKTSAAKKPAAPKKKAAAKKK
jgi:hypothetical protein